MPTNCTGVSRRDTLHFGLGALLGGGLLAALRARGFAADAVNAPAARAKACILIWMDGGPTHFETFDPKPDAPAEYRGEFKAIPTAVPGVHFSEHLPRLAKNLGRFALIRSIRHEQGNHGAGNHYMMTGAPPRIPVGCGGVRQLPPQHGIRGRAREAARRRRAAGVLLHAEHDAQRRAELPRRQVRAVRGRGRP